MTRAIALALILVLAGCAVAPSLTDAEQAVADAARAERDAGKISWMEWDRKTSHLVVKAGPRAYAHELAAFRTLIAERVDKKMMTPAEGSLMLAQAVGGVSRRQEAEAAEARARFRAALQAAGNSMNQTIAANTPRPPLTTTCRRLLNQVVCETQ
jgi:hypothetical protein